MPPLIIAIIVASVVVTAALTWVLLRINAPSSGAEKRLSGADAGPHFYGAADSEPAHHHGHHGHDAGGDSGGDGGGDGGGGE